MKTTQLPSPCCTSKLMSSGLRLRDQSVRDCFVISINRCALLNSRTSFSTQALV